MFRTLLLSLSITVTAWAQTTPQDNDQLLSVVILARHGVRSPIASETRSSAFNAQPWPAWPVEPGTLTPHGVEALKRMGEFYRQRYGSLLTNGCNSVYAESTNTSRTIASAKATLSAVVPGCTIDVHADLLQDPETIDRQRLADATNGRMANQPEWFEHAFATPLAEMHTVLAACNRNDTNCDTKKPDFRTTMLQTSGSAPNMSQPGTPLPGIFVPRDPRKESSVALGADFAENFLLQYVEGMPMEQIGWGRVSRSALDRLMEMNTRYHDFILRTPYYAQQAAGPLAKRISDTLLYAHIHAETVVLNGQQTNANPEFGRRFFFLSAHDANLTWMGGLLRIDWLVSDETFNSTPPGSALVFELHHNKQTNANTVRVLFIAQKLDQIRNLTSLTGAEHPSISPVYVPNCSGGAPDYACTLKDFAQVVTDAASASLSPKASSPAPAAKAQAHPATSRPQSPLPSTIH